ncbi:Kelch-like protein 30 [Cytospora mali]|uniref:Kelch-like protein 30 n=1 Tax=Cytospora mali TaxID=578113 RepID=A0A194V2X4_CYTMA|nr:Kelch-like protein 30 [Valsa mali var. pyri (nom. inval.)]
MAGFKRFYDNEALSDFMLIFSGHKVPVHKVILSAQNKYFSKLFEGPFAESSATSVELHEDDPVALQHLLKCLYGYEVDIFGEHYAESLMRADPREPEPKDGWSDIAIKNCLNSNFRHWNHMTRAWKLSPRCRKAFAETVELYLVADKYLAAEVCDDQVRRLEFSLLHRFFYNTLFLKEEEPVDVSEIAEIFDPLYERTAGHEDKMRRKIAGFFDGWWVTSVGATPDQLLVLYDALPDLRSDVLQLRASRDAEKGK